jgi:phytoene dehydrogenase-like protein
MPDVIVICGGHNGLTVAAYLAAAGLKVAVFERRAVVGSGRSPRNFIPASKASAIFP